MGGFLLLMDCFITMGGFSFLFIHSFTTMGVCLFSDSLLSSGKAVEIVIDTCVLCMYIFVKFVFLCFLCFSLFVCLFVCQL
jgi:hypothetical protein